MKGKNNQKGKNNPKDSDVKEAMRYRQWSSVRNARLSPSVKTTFALLDGRYVAEEKNAVSTQKTLTVLFQNGQSLSPWEKIKLLYECGKKGMRTGKRWKSQEFGSNQEPRVKFWYTLLTTRKIEKKRKEITMFEYEDPDEEDEKHWSDFDW